MTFLCKNGTYNIGPGLVAHYRVTYPRLDIDDEFTRVAMWLLANPSKRKTANGMPRFLVAWLNRSLADRQRRPVWYTEPTYTAESGCPHDPPCDAPGRWACLRKTQLDALRGTV